MKRLAQLARVGASAIMLGNVAFGLGWSQVAHAAPAYQYIALGDSIASGHGIHPYATGSGDEDCKRAAGTTPGVDYSYPYYVRDFLELQRPVVLDPANFHLLACTGAKAEDLHKQVNKALKLLGESGSGTPSPGVISITIGADNFNFSSPDTYNQAFSPLTYGQFEKFREKQANIITKNLTAEMKRLLSKKVDRQVVVTGYYNPFNTESVIFDTANLLGANCGSMIWPRPTCQQVINDTVQILNDAIAAAVNNVPGNVRFVSGDTMLAAFSGHESPRSYCGSAAPEFADSYIQALNVEFPMSTTFPPEDGADCFHPNELGHEAIGYMAISVLPYGS